MSNVAILRTPPNSIEAEQAVIGGILLKPDVLLDVDLLPSAFFRFEHRLIWETIARLHDERKAIDVITLSEALHDSGQLQEAGGLEYLGDLVASIHSAANVRHYAEIIRGRALERTLISKGNRLAEIGYGDGSSLEKLTEALALLTDLEAGEGDEPEAIDVALKESVNALEYRHDHKGEIQGLRTGFPDLDNQLLGLADGDLIICAGRPSAGKTTIVMNIAETTAMAGGLVIVFSLEMSRRKLTDRMICSIAKVDNKRFKLGDIHGDDWDRISSAIAKLRGRPYYIDDSGLITSAQLLSRARRIARRLNQKPALIIVDYLQQLNDRGEGVERVTKISRNLKLTAKELNCPLIAVSQLSRKCEDRNDKRPVMSDLRDSGSIEQDADIILMLYRDEVYNENSQHAGIAEVIVRKARDGEIGTVYLSSALSRCRFETLAPGSRPAPLAKALKGSGRRFEHYDD